MKFKQLALLDFEDDYFEADHLARLRSLADEVVVVREGTIAKRDELIRNADALLIRFATPLDRTTLDRLPHLNYIGASSTAIDRVDIAYAKEKSITITHPTDYGSNAIAEFVFGALLTHIRHLPDALRAVEKNDLTPHPTYRGFELRGKTFGIVGLGHIGQRVGELARGFGMNVCYFSRTRKPAYEANGMTYAPLDDVLASDIVGIFLALADETRGIISENRIAHIKRDAIVISPSHTELFDFDALVRALDADQFSLIQSYFSTIPDEHRDALLAARRAIIYPSIAIATREANERTRQLMIEQIEAFLK